jgi:hypothetical protein
MPNSDALSTVLCVVNIVSLLGGIALPLWLLTRTNWGNRAALWVKILLFPVLAVVGWLIAGVLVTFLATAVLDLLWPIA